MDGLRTPQETTRFWWAVTTIVLAGQLSQCVQQQVNVSQALVSFFLFLDGTSVDCAESPSCVHVASRTSEPILTPMGISFDDTKLDPSDRQALTPGIKTALRRLHVNLGHPTNDDLTRWLAVGGGTRVAHWAVKSMRCSTCERMSRPRSHRPSWWMCAETSYCDCTKSHESQAVAKKSFKHWIRWAGPLTCWCATESEAWEHLRFSRKNSLCQDLRCKRQLHILRGRRVSS